MRKEWSGRPRRSRATNAETLQPHRRWHRHLIVAALSLLPSVAGAACPRSTLPPVSLPHLSQALQRQEEVLVVAIGSSSTAGARASDPAHTYPAILQVELERALPAAHIAVVNRGVGGQDAVEMVPRLDSDVVAARPALVIWQVGANGAMRGTDPRQFAELVSGGVRHLEETGADVVLMDNQRSPKILASPEHAAIDAALAEVALRDQARLFARGRLMDLWQDEGRPYAEFLDADGIHHNDLGYACLAKAVASSILRGLAPAAQASR